jgi:hypothetical protein
MKAVHFFEAWIHSTEGLKVCPCGTFPAGILQMGEKHGEKIGEEAKRYYERLYRDYHGPPTPPVNT